MNARDVLITLSLFASMLCVAALAAMMWMLVFKMAGDL